VRHDATGSSDATTARVFGPVDGPTSADLDPETWSRANDQQSETAAWYALNRAVYVDAGFLPLASYRLDPRPDRNVA
jgi:hypothetical protein